MDKKIRFEITSDGEIHAKTIGMDDERCLDYVEVFERILDAETVESSFTQEFLDAQNIQTEEEQLDVEQNVRSRSKRD